MKNVKTLALAITLAFSASAQAGGIPTADGVASGQRMTQFMENVRQFMEETKRWQKTSQHYKQELQAYADQLATQTGARDVAEFINEARSIYDELDKAKKEIVSSAVIMEKGKEALKEEALALFKKYNLFDRCENSNLVAQRLCEAEVANNVENIVTIGAMEKRLNKKIRELDRLSYRMASATDSKEAQDLANTMQVKLAALQAEKLRFDMHQAEQVNYENLRKEQQRQLMAEREIHGKIPTFN